MTTQNQTPNQTQRRILKSLGDVEKATRLDLKASKRSLTSLLENGWISETVEGEGEEATSFYSITASGSAAIAPAPKPEPIPFTLSDTLIRVLGLLEDGEWHTASELNTSHQNHGRLVDQKLAKMKMDEERGKLFQITANGKKELAHNRKLAEDAKNK